MDDWKDIHRTLQHGLGLCYNASNINIIEVIDIPRVLEVLLFVLEIEKETFLLAIVDRMSGPLGMFIDDFILLINEPSAQPRIFIVKDFNLDQMLPENVAKVHPLIQNFNLSQHFQYSAHIHRGALDLVFDSLNSNTFIQNLAFNYLPFRLHVTTHKYSCWYLLFHIWWRG